MGLDIGTTSIAATLFNRSTSALYPIGWIDSERAELGYQLPAVAYFSTTALSNPVSPPEAIAWSALTVAQTAIAGSTPSTTGLLVHRFKPYLNAAIPYLSPQTQRWEPWIQLSERQALPLRLVHQALATLLATLTQVASPASNSPAPSASSPSAPDPSASDPSASDPSAALLSCAARWLAPATLAEAMPRLAGVIVSHPVGSSDAYRFNLREAVLASGLATQPESIFCVEEVVAALMAEIATSDRPNLEPKVEAIKGETVVISAGAIATELLLVRLSAEIQSLKYENFHLRRLPYAGNALDQDIICQLLYPRSENWEELNLQDLDLPLPGEPDLEARFRLQQRLEGVALGHKLLNAVRQMKPALCRQDGMVRVDDHTWMLKRQDLQNWVIAPYLQQLNRELDILLKQADVLGEAVQQVICTGGTGSIPAIAQWLQQKFPQAHLIQDPMPDLIAGKSTVAGGNPAIHRVAQGLALVSRFPNVLNRDRHRYNDYFLLRELLDGLKHHTDQPLSLGRILSLLQEQGIHTESCQSTILRLLEGQLPTGLLPSRASAVMMRPDSLSNPDYHDLTAASLFSRLDHQVYRLNSAHRDRLWKHLEIILANTYQTLEEPLTVGLDSSTVDG